MIETTWIPRAAAAALVFGGVAAGSALAAGCGSSQTPPTTEAQAQAQSAPGDGAEGHHRHMPPPAAFDACKDKATGDTCTVAWHDGEIHGKCAPPPPGASGTGNACRPEGKHHHHHGPPPEKVFAACDGKGAGDACTVHHEKGDATGSCMAPKHADGGAGRLLCAAAHGKKNDGGT